MTTQKQVNLSQFSPLGAQDVAFPFKWRYAKILELSEEEKLNINRPRGRKQQYKLCAICGVGGNLTHRKVSDGNPCLICEECANRYVFSAIRLSRDMKIGSDGK